ncbi:hypothetical protein [Flavilitoribacter nigricans]|uniref:NTPase n=1 Tax=Flavilitoribacter nigricans (strain ATCC 23147 / DSM 23189 / NBRC 102662 / NCIMB 1420 / SS-2) TaxID=1122177 RepID=A0A2D0N1F6_FLAN2|nr:hypothetical protein [Flavilitoribacter nigricans]PHN02297.1 hypothetical protein CRP01_32890 [Flavilitoribacter nigricans DSM 23189 = NBRC 102662]
MSFDFFIFTAPVKAGKTTSLMNWAKDKPGLGGFLAPDIDDVRHLYTLGDRRLHQFQLQDELVTECAPEEIVNIHRFNFSAEAFAMARRTLLEDLQRGYEWIIVDEVGKLELRGEGLEPAIREAVEMVKSGRARGKLLMVVRDELVAKVMQHYRLWNCRIIRLGDGMPD